MSMKKDSGRNFKFIFLNANIVFSFFESQHRIPICFEIQYYFHLFWNPILFSIFWKSNLVSDFFESQYYFPLKLSDSFLIFLKSNLNPPQIERPRCIDRPVRYNTPLWLDVKYLLALASICISRNCFLFSPPQPGRLVVNSKLFSVVGFNQRQLTSSRRLHPISLLVVNSLIMGLLCF